VEQVSIGKDGKVWLAVCAWCDRVRLGESWVTQFAAARAMRTIDLATPLSFTHSICPDCFARNGGHAEAQGRADTRAAA
jgi:hypothetical protein